MPQRVTVEIKKLDHARDLPLPSYGTLQSAGADVYAALEKSVVLPAGDRFLVPTGIQMQIPMGIEVQIRSRSGLSWNNGIIVLNAPATIDPDYRGELKVILMNLGQDSFVIERGMRVAQLVFAPFFQVNWQCVEHFSDQGDTERQDKGFGSTGLYESIKRGGT